LELSNLYRGPSKDAFYKVLIHLAKRFRGEDFLEINQSETRIVCGGHVLTNMATTGNSYFRLIAF
jgi:hypothetical protein